MEMQSLRVNTGIKIEVNDNGDHIVAYMGDQNFVRTFYDMVEKMDHVARNMSSEKTEKLSALEKLQLSSEMSKEMMMEIDKTFGEGACEKIFGVGIVPTGYALGDLFDQLIPVFQEYADERQKKIGEKYNRNRKGNRDQRRNRGR